MRIRKVFSIPFIVIFITSLLYLPTTFLSFADNSCFSKQFGRNNNNNCNQQSQGQSQDQTQNNNQNVNISLNQPAPVAPVAQLIAVAPATQLPKTGSPTEALIFITGAALLGFFLRKFSNTPIESGQKYLPVDKKVN